ncbi:acyl-CoA dehydrogenase family protein [Nocardioides sp. SYSU D00038]|uniref:acyl-CoA dehydrogenase family protein n=1 Tax=Nocardioides sp. SYSU D00038 TaxID=2812554 RepID=UPI0019672FF0|nr:acyl-CoA dehydrogenase family protein [Nocardioides sp. SYSU D00038]
MRFEPTSDQRDFAAAVDGLLSASDTVAVARAWAEGDTEPGLRLWSRLAEQGVNALLVPEDVGGLGASRVELVIAFELLGRHGVPGPWVESAAYLPVALTDTETLAALAEGAVGTVAAPPHAPLALDADVADHVYLATATGLVGGAVGTGKVSVDRTRRLFEVSGVDGDGSPAPLDAAFDSAALATAAQLLGAGERLLADSVTYVKQRKQFGREIGSYQAIKHALADVRIGLDFARPLLLGAALGEVPAGAAKVACGDAAYRASRTGLQVHGAIGYTQEFDLSVWVTKVRALVTAWGTPALHRGRLLESLVGA